MHSRLPSFGDAVVRKLQAAGFEDVAVGGIANGSVVVTVDYGLENAKPALIVLVDRANVGPVPLSRNDAAGSAGIRLYLRGITDDEGERQPEIVIERLDLHDLGPHSRATIAVGYVVENIKRTLLHLSELEGAEPTFSPS